MFYWILAGCVVVLSILLIEIYRETHRFRVTRYAIPCYKWEKEGSSVRAVFLSDLHNKEYGKGNSVLLKAVKKEHPDLILIGGDLLIGKPGRDFQAAADLVNQLCQIAPVYYANGNHEQRMKEYPERYGDKYASYRQLLLKAGAHMLENTEETVRIKNRTICISGLEIPMNCYDKLKKRAVSVYTIEEKLGFQPKQAHRRQVTQILLAHNPAYVQSYLSWGADLVLSGHQHGGLICLPGGKAVFTPQFHLFPKYNGECTIEGEKAVVVSRGLGTHTIPVRLFNPAELVVLTLKGEKHT